MKIGIDTFACNVGISGTGVYLTQILKRISSPDVFYELFGWEFDRFSFANLSKQLDFIPVGRISGKTANSLWHIFKFPHFAESRAYNACFFPVAHRRLPSTFPCYSVGTVHDMAAYWGTRQTREHLGAVLRVLLPDSLRKLDRVIAVSNWVKNELINLVNIRPSRIDVIPNGVDTSIFYPRPPDGENPVLIQPFSFKRPYILYAARLHHPVKNHIGLIKAFEIFKERIKSPHRLVFAGSDDHGAERIKAVAAASKCRNDIFFTGNFPSASLPELYAASDFVVIPSCYEGFGQGAIEAMASGVPVACARAAALPETAEHAALYFNPFQPEDMADRMVSLATDSELHNKLVRLGIERAKLFSWDKCAEQTLRIVRDEA
ncbi:MAG: glycosyltransferase family 4 protein [Spirochaetaceae bacterium]|jgi:glycosyltransferase involved in cell wall biosynthesis|nr:glycosyltransferase family 4 protein [Spirochaetaceae bacterium]